MRMRCAAIPGGHYWLVSGIASQHRHTPSFAFDGPVALQGFGLTGAARDNLARSMAAWRKMHAR